MPVTRLSADAGHLCRIENGDHEDVVRYVPLAGDVVSACRPEPETWIERRVPDDDDVGASGTGELLVTSCDQPASEASTLILC